jgi:nitrite reductase (NAD(P)H)
MAPPGLLSEESSEKRRKVVVVGLGMVGLAFIEKLIQKDKKRREYKIVVLGEEKHVAYNRVGLTSFFCIFCSQILINL